MSALPPPVPRSASEPARNAPKTTASLLERRASLYHPLAIFDHQRAWERLGNALVRGAFSGFCLRGGLHLVGLLFALVLKSRKKHRAHSINLWQRLQDTLRYTAFLGSLSGVYVAADEAIAAVVGKRKSAKWRALVAGAAAGPTILLTGRKDRHTSLALYILLRGITLLVRCGNKPSAPKPVQLLLTPTRWKHGDTALMCLATSQILYSWMMLPQTLPAAYVRFLNKHGGKERWRCDAIRELAIRNKQGLEPGPLKLLQHTDLRDFHARIPCGILHPGQTCNQHFASFLPEAYLRALPVYLPVYFLPAILVHRKHLIQKETAAKIWRRVGLGVLRSSLFLALYCTLAWRGACAAHNLTGRTTGFIIAASCWAGGLATLAEKKSRRMELALYCLSRAAESFALCLAQWGWVHPRSLPKRLDVLIFCAAVAAIMHCYSDSHGRHRDVFRSKYLNVLDFVFGNTGFEDDSLKHHPSTKDLLNRITPEVRMPVNTLAWRERCGSFVGGLERLGEARDSLDSPRSTSSDLGIPTGFRSLPPNTPER
ncbi:hypothetical protein WJX72_001016 [[Myrmecia] bisecta]|uniref:Transmembrane protein 135 N-terminal domain-containing protein n=1 Tax=[Myrmecia] bisecta TaxID=41462 RepID=A0AAW1P9W9_9CHLO